MSSGAAAVSLMKAVGSEECRTGVCSEIGDLVQYWFNEYVGGRVSGERLLLEFDVLGLLTRFDMKMLRRDCGEDCGGI